TFRYRVLHVAARITHGARQVRLRIDATWAWATAIATGWGRIRTAFGHGYRAAPLTPPYDQRPSEPAHPARQPGRYHSLHAKFARPQANAIITDLQAPHSPTP